MAGANHPPHTNPRNRTSKVTKIKVANLRPARGTTAKSGEPLPWILPAYAFEIHFEPFPINLEALTNETEKPGSNTNENCDARRSQYN